MKVMIIVTHLLGSGHLSRALTLGRAFGAAGHEVCVVSGGLPAPHLDATGVRLIQLPALRSDGTAFTRLLRPDGSPVDAGWLDGRRAILLEHFDRFAPDLLICELFPFGRRILSEEFLPLLETANARPKRPVTLCSIRDILAPPSKPAKAQRAEEIVARHFDAVLVHSDPNILRLEDSWPVSNALSEQLRYTGFVAPPAAAPHPDGAGADEIIVSAGGGAVGEALYRCAAHAAQQSDWPWRLLVGGTDPAPRIQALRDDTQAPGLVIEAARPDFRQMLHHARASVSLCGYNTALDLLQTGAPSVLVPFDAGGELEQTIRARSLARRTGFAMLDSGSLTPARLLQALNQVLEAPRRVADPDCGTGAARSVEIATQLLEARK